MWCLVLLVSLNLSVASTRLVYYIHCSDRTGHEELIKEHSYSLSMQDAEMRNFVKCVLLCAIVRIRLSEGWYEEIVFCMRQPCIVVSAIVLPSARIGRGKIHL